MCLFARNSIQYAANFEYTLIIRLAHLITW